MAKARRGRGQGSIFLGSDGRWRSVVTNGTKPDGKPNRKTFYGKTSGEVQRKLWAWQLGSRQAAARAVPTVATYLDSWIERRECSEKTRDGYEIQVRLHVKPRIGDVKMDRLQVSHVKLVIDQMMAADCGTDAISRLLKLLRSAFDGAEALSGQNPARGVPIPKHLKAEIHPLTVEQVLALLDAAAGRKHGIYPMCLLAVDSGMRQGELFALEWTDFDWSSASVLVQRNLVEHRGKLYTKPPKSGKGRRVELTAKTIGVLREYQKQATGSIVFPAPKGGYWSKSNWVERSWEPMLSEAGISYFKFHTLRHTCATLLLLAGENPKVISERLGHANIQITLSIYAHVLPAMQRGATTKMEQMLQKEKDA